MQGLRNVILIPILAFIRKHRWPILMILCFLLASYLIVSSDYNHLHADAGIFGRSARIFYKEKKIDLSGIAPALIGQILFTDLFFHLFGFNLKNFHIIVYLIDFLFLFGMYLLLIEFGVNQFLALFGSLTLLISPISLRMIDWYMTEPFFMFYLIFSLLFIIKGLRQKKLYDFYIGSIFCTLGILTRQYAISIPVALMITCIIYRKKINHRIIIHSIISILIPLIAIGAFYILISLNKTSGTAAPHAYTSAKLGLISIFTNPLNLFLKLYFGSLYFLHYSSLYLTPLFIILLFSFFIKPKQLINVFSNFPFSIFCILYVSFGTIYLYITNNQLMPYLPSIFSIGHLTKIFTFSLINKHLAAFFLTGFTLLGAIIIFIKIGDFFYLHNDNFFKNDPIYKLRGKTKRKMSPEVDFGERFFYFWGFVYIMLTIILTLKYDRYIYPISILMIYIILKHFPSLKELKKISIVVYSLILLIFIFKHASRRLSLDLAWESSQSLLNEGISSHEINGGLGFNNYYNFAYIDNLYKNVKIKRPINWRKFHPLANFFVKGKSHLEKKHKGLILYKTHSKKRLFGILKKKVYVYRRKKNYSGRPIWL